METNNKIYLKQDS